MKFLKELSMITLICVQALYIHSTEATENGLLQALMEQREEVVQAVVMYPEDTRHAIFVAATRPDAIIRLGNLQAHTRQKFEALLSTYGQEDQQKLYELSRYPGLVAAISKDGFQESDLQEFPEEIHGVAAEFSAGPKRNALDSLHGLNVESNNALTSTLLAFDEEVQQSLRSLVKDPQVLEILVENIDLTTALGDVYREDPQQIEQRAEEMHELAKQEKEIISQSWVSSFVEDSLEMQEMQSLANQYEEEDDRPEYVYTGPSTVSVNYVYYPYSYWYGYPRWYRHAYWHHYPMWHHTGFYVTSNGTVVIVDSPSYAYTTWYYDDYYHHHHYAHLSIHFDRQYDINIDVQNGDFFNAVRDWRGRDGNGRQTVDRDAISSGVDSVLADRNGDLNQVTGKAQTMRTSMDADRTSQISTMRAAGFHQRAWSGRGGSRPQFGGGLRGRR